MQAVEFIGLSFGLLGILPVLVVAFAFGMSILASFKKGLSAPKHNGRRKADYGTTELFYRGDALVISGIGKKYLVFPTARQKQRQRKWKKLPEERGRNK